MPALFDEFQRRFPELRDQTRDDAELPYLLMDALVGWLRALGTEEFSPALVGRVVAFARWCEAQPRGQTASDDLYTVLCVGLYEKLFRAETTRRLLPRLVTREELLANADYLRAWVRPEDYAATLHLYDVKA